ncbi:hypothetical protein L226DRAFT_573259 [Lentinus tigrinus ALCF2SS1-7]|uniref:F-box domain-containing protein n=1 Tax=Lentinus tigrinus ALCF2SS1-6 TaxID=1328759 RepID=A0A5C2S3P9_9APHY|nr:hypothetical protein L227DRAFT_565025 [Lentinus tigrinus ALCF2SS1-6]RPD72192.1 hypothetical protein L226DRAFT_573259 [Lentinus tigrinus ALCF2SS1-7]
MDADDIPTTSPRLPIELCEHIIGAVYSERFYLVSDALATLSRCSLVCRAWRPRSQMILFTYVLLKDKAMLHRFAALLDGAPHLGRYVRTLSLRGHHHRPDSTVVLFPTVLRNRLPSLVRLSIAEEQPQVDAVAESATGTNNLKKPPLCLPIHPRFPALMTKFAHIRELNLSNTTFPSFGDLCRILDRLTGLQEILALSVSYAVLGLLPQCMLKDVGKLGASKRFLPNLRALLCYDMGEEGTQRLTAALGPSLLKLWVKFPNEPVLSKADNPLILDDHSEPLVGLDLQQFRNLAHLGFRLGRGLREDAAAREALGATLLSWAALITTGSSDGTSHHSQGSRNQTESVKNRYLHLGAWWRAAFTRDEYVALFRTLGAMVEETLVAKKADPGSSETRRSDRSQGQGQGQPQPGEEAPQQDVDPCLVTVVVRDLGDRLDWEDWWSAQMVGCFPTFSTWNRLVVQVVHAGNPNDRWKGFDDAPPENASVYLDERARLRMNAVKKAALYRGQVLR